MKNMRIFIITAIMMCVIGMISVNAEENEHVTEVSETTAVTEVTETSAEETTETTVSIPEETTEATSESQTTSTEISTDVTETTAVTTTVTTTVTTENIFKYEFSYKIANNQNVIDHIEITGMLKAVSDIEMNELTWFDLGGCLGVNPKDIYKYLKAHKMSYKKYTSFSSFEKAAKNKKKTCIVGFKLKNSNFKVHTVALYWNGSKWIVYNRFNSSKGTESYSKLSDLTSSKKFIVGYVM